MESKHEGDQALYCNTGCCRVLQLSPTCSAHCPSRHTQGAPTHHHQLAQCDLRIHYLTLLFLRSFVRMYEEQAGTVLGTGC